MLIQVVHLRSEIVLRCLIESFNCRTRLVFKPSYRGPQFTPSVSPKPRPELIILLSGRPNPFRRIDTRSRSQDRAARLSNSRSMSSQPGATFQRSHFPPRFSLSAFSFLVQHSNDARFSTSETATLRLLLLSEILITVQHRPSLRPILTCCRKVRKTTY